MNGYECVVQLCAVYGVGRFFLAPKKGSKASDYSAARALGRAVRRIRGAGQSEVQALPRKAAAVPAASLPEAPAAVKQEFPETELRGEALMGRISELRMAADREGLKRVMSAALRDGRLELDGEGRPQPVGATAKAKKGKAH